jgi:hypothetical protein
VKPALALGDRRYVVRQAEIVALDLVRMAQQMRRQSACQGGFAYALRPGE